MSSIAAKTQVYPFFWSNVLGKWYGSDGAGVWPAADAADEVNGSADLQSCEAGA